MQTWRCQDDTVHLFKMLDGGCCPSVWIRYNPDTSLTSDVQINKPYAPVKEVASEPMMINDDSSEEEVVSC